MIYPNLIIFFCNTNYGLNYLTPKLYNCQRNFIKFWPLLLKIIEYYYRLLPFIDVNDVININFIIK